MGVSVGIAVWVRFSVVVSRGVSVFSSSLVDSSVVGSDERVGVSVSAVVDVSVDVAVSDDVGGSVVAEVLIAVVSSVLCWSLLSLSLSTGTLFLTVVASVESAVIVLARVSVLVGPSIEIVGVADDPLSVAAVLSSAFPVVLLDLGDCGEGDCPTVADD